MEADAIMNRSVWSQTLPSFECLETHIAAATCPFPIPSATAITGTSVIVAVACQPTAAPDRR